MYRNPFGSIFSAHLEPKKSKAEKMEEETPSTKDANDPNTTEDANPQPEAKTEPFQNTVPQFRATVDYRINPKLMLQLSKYTLNQKLLKQKLTEQDASTIKDRINASKLYKKVLTDFMGLSQDDKDKIISWVKDNSKALGNITQAKQLQKDATKTLVKSADLDVQIKHMENVLSLKDQGINIDGSPILEYYTPIKHSQKADLPDSNKIPKIRGHVPMDQWYTLKQLGDSDADSDDDFEDPLLKKPYFYTVKRSLPSPSDYGRARQEKYEESQINKKIEKNVVLAREAEWQTKISNQEKQESVKKYKILQKKVADLVSYINRGNQDNVMVTTALGVLTEANPEIFTSGALLDNLNRSLKTASQLGDASNPAPIDPTQVLVEQAAVNNQVAQQELQTRQDTITTLQAKITDTSPAPPPAPMVVTIPQPDILQTIKNLLPWAIGLFILLKIVG